MKKVTKDILKTAYRKRDLSSIKYDNGYVLIIGGGQHYTGAPALSAMAALRSGADMTRVLAPERASNIIAGFSPNLSTYSLKGELLNEEDLEVLLSMTNSALSISKVRVALCIGGGLGRSEETKRTVIDYLKAIKLKGVIDADAIHAVALDDSVCEGFLLTPHIHEFFVLTQKDLKGLPLEEKAEIVKTEALRLKCTILLTGKIDIISDGREVFLNETGTPNMTVAGTGDTLSGICASLIAQGLDALTSAQAGSYINGKAGELASQKKGVGMLATDLIEEIVNVIN